MVSWRSAANWLSVSVAVSLPATLTVPLVGRSSPPMMFSSVDFPLPLGPIRQTNSPGITCSSAATSALTTSSPSLCSFHTSEISITGARLLGTRRSVLSVPCLLMAVMSNLPLVSDRMGGRDAAFHVGTMLVASAATMLTPTAMRRAEQQARPPTRRSPPNRLRQGRFRSTAASTAPSQRSQHRRDHRFDQQGGHHRLARDAVGAEHAQFPRAVCRRCGWWRPPPRRHRPTAP